MFATFQLAVEKKQGISRLEQLVEEISEAERAKEMKKEQKRLKRKAKRKEKCKLISQITEASDSDLKAGEELQKEDNGTKENVEVTEELNGHRDSWGDDEDEVNSNGSPCSCDDLNGCEQRKPQTNGFVANGHCGLV